MAFLTISQITLNTRPSLIYTFFTNTDQCIICKGIHYYFLCFQSYRMWKCKDYNQSFSQRSDLLKHYRIDHRFHGRRRPYPCIHANCPCSSKTWNGLQKHLTRSHPSQKSTPKLSSFKCFVCDNNQLSMEYDFFLQINI